MITLFPDEIIVSSSSNDTVVLTTHRICYEHKEFGRSYNQSIMLEHITSCENHSVSKYSFLMIAGVLAVLSLVIGSNRNKDEAALAFAAAIIFAILFWFTRRNQIVIGSPSTKMLINVTGMRREKVLSFINTIEQTKHRRVLSINNKI